MIIFGVIVFVNRWEFSLKASSKFTIKEEAAVKESDYDDLSDDDFNSKKKN